MLKEHFRCVPEIIQFSNALAYDGKIQPLRDASTVSLKPHWVGYQVTAVSQQKGRDKTNDEEAQKIVFIVKAMTQHPAYKGKTIGIIPLVGSEIEQVKVIQTQLLQHLTEEQREIFQIKCATASQFQGDERDVILLSMVDKPSIEPNQPLSLVTEDGNDFRESKKYNVAVSRAKDQIWVVHSISPNALKMRDIRRQLLDYAYSQADTLKAEQEKELRKVEKAQNSEFEKRVIAALMGRGYSLQAQHPVGSYSIDILVQDALTGNRLAVECDGDRWHTPDNLDEDLERQRILERCGYTFYRIRGTNFFRYPEREIDKLCNKLSTFSIHPENRQSVTYNENTLVQDLLKSADQFNFEGA
jgi:very-short-patch-repair endonuclease